MLLCGLDLETTGFDPEKDHITELGYMVKHAGEKRPGIVKVDLLWDDSYGESPISKEIQEITGISNRLLNNYGILPSSALQNFLDATMDVEFFVAHNAAFDRPFLRKKLEQYGFANDGWKNHPVWDDKKWLCSQSDIEHKGKSTHLGYCAADHGFLNPFPHSALFDVATMMRIVDQYPIEQIIARAQMPWVVLRAMCDFNNKEAAKARRFRWQEPGNGKTYKNCWVKMVKQDKVEEERKLAGFTILELETC